MLHVCIHNLVPTPPGLLTVKLLITCCNAKTLIASHQKLDGGKAWGRGYVCITAITNLHQCPCFHEGRNTCMFSGGSWTWHWSLVRRVPMPTHGYHLVRHCSKCACKESLWIYLLWGWEGVNWERVGRGEEVCVQTWGLNAGLSIIKRRKCMKSLNLSWNVKWSEGVRAIQWANPPNI